MASHSTPFYLGGLVIHGSCAIFPGCTSEFVEGSQLEVKIAAGKMGVEPKNRGGFYPPNHPLKNRVFHDFHHPFWGVFFPLFLG